MWSAGTDLPPGLPTASDLTRTKDILILANSQILTDPTVCVGMTVVAGEGTQGAQKWGHSCYSSCEHHSLSPRKQLQAHFCPPLYLR